MAISIHSELESTFLEDIDVIARLEKWHAQELWFNQPTDRNLRVLTALDRLDQAADFLSEDFHATSLRRSDLPAHPGLLSVNERRRIKRAIYRLELYCLLFGERSQIREGQSFYKGHKFDRQASEDFHGFN